MSDTQTVTSGGGALAFLSDHETKVDLLNNEAIAATIVRLLLERPDRPVTIGVHGDWGAGKSSVLEMIEAGLEGREDILCLKFNGWRFQGFEDAKIALLEGIVTGLLDKRPALRKAADKVKAVFRRIDWLKVAKRAGGLAFTAYTGIPLPDQLQAVISTVESALTDPAKFATKDSIKTVYNEALTFLKPETESKNVPEEVEEFRKAFDDLLKAAELNQLVVLIDDLDRCLPEPAIETLEAIRLFVFTSRTAFVVAADEAMIEYAVRKHFPDLPDTTGPQTYARNYLEKLIQVPFRIPTLGVTETRIYVALLLAGAELGENNADFEKLISAARELLKRPWTGKILDMATVKTALGDGGGRLQHTLTLSEQIGPILAIGAKGNPRQIKRFLNALVLRLRTADARGFGDDVKLPVLAKLMLAERFQPRLFEQIALAAAASPEGCCDDIAPLEEGLVQDSQKAPSKDKTGGLTRAKIEAKDAPTREATKQPESAQPREATKPQESAQLTEWRSSPFVREWATIEPKLAGVDLRPYLFVTKDKKDYFGATTVLGHLATIADQLMGPEIAVLGQLSDLKQLAMPEATEVFEIVRGRIIGGDSFDKQPLGIAGINVLVRAHPSLQSNLLDLLESLPIDRLGVWVVQGWESVIVEADANARFDKLLQIWANNTKNALLKVTAENVFRMRKGRR